MVDQSQRDLLKYTEIATTAISATGAGTAVADDHSNDPSESTMGRLDLLGHAFLDNLPGIYSNGVVREDGQYGLLGGYYGEGGSFLADLTDPTQAYRLSSDTTNRQNDVECQLPHPTSLTLTGSLVEGGKVILKGVDRLRPSFNVVERVIKRFA